jgi:hypothetical protein
MDIWKADPTFTNYVPETAVEAVGRYVRCRKNGLAAMMIPECLIECSRGLTSAELDKFEQWVINPQADLSKLDLVEVTAIREANDDLWVEAVDRVTGKIEANARVYKLLSLACDDDEKTVSADDEKLIRES